MSAYALWYYMYSVWDVFCALNVAVPPSQLQVLALFALIACAASEDDTSDDDLDEALLKKSNAAAGWGIFLCFMAMLTESVIILMRFLNCGFISSFLTISMIVVSD